ncbi:SLC13 family permease [Nisaea acidiphila]|uniref:SLC13 family permease n=1 Tax=Nisaea acidiphila TaxID=1862145 RepID=A0A9J7AUD6_9PROT|nr:SLC13 family permease [Nisaea acidiphila]UUX51347.1 SLC13 family permease [Nisaea acidiphila]
MAAIQRTDPNIVSHFPLVLGAALFVLLLLLPPPGGLPPAAWHTVAVAALMAVWWIGEAVPLPVTALLPILLFPLLGIADLKEAAAPFAHPVVYLFLGGFLLGAAITSSGLHARIATAILHRTGTGSRRLVAGFLLAGALPSMWISNTASAIMLLPVAQSVLDGAPVRLRKALLLSVAYGCSIGGLATLIGTPPNAMLAAFLDQSYGTPLGFAKWLAIGLPIMLAMLVLAWLVLTRFAFGPLEELEADALPHPGPMTAREKRIAVVLAIAALAWIFRPTISSFLPAISDTAIALAAGLALFVVPAGSEKRALLNWDEARAIRWGILVLFGGGLSLANAISGSGLAEALAGTLSAAVGYLPDEAAPGLSAAIVLFATELASNTASAAAFLPITAELAEALGLPLLAMLAPVTLAASCAFMMPVATPPNAIVFGAGGLRVADMARAGLWMNAGAVMLLTALGWILIRAGI